MPDNSELIEQLQAEIMNKYREENRRIGNTSGFFDLIQRFKPYGAVKWLLDKESKSKGFDKLYEAGLLRLTAEATALEPNWKSLFTLKQRQAAWDRLKAHRYDKLGPRPTDEAISPNLADSSLPTIMLTWNPVRTSWDDFQDNRRMLHDGQRPSFRWSTGNNQSVVEGQRVFMLKQGSDPRGIFASGWTTSDSYIDDSWEDTGKSANYVDVELDVLLNPDREEIIGVDQLMQFDPRAGFWATPSSGITIPVVVADQIEIYWHELLERQRIRPVNDSDFETNEDVLPVGDAPLKKLAEVTLRPDQSKFRDTVIKHYGGCCVITGSNLEAILQACHLIPHAEGGTSDASNGLLLRVDVHILFDLNLIAIDPTTWTVRVSDDLNGTDYYELHGKAVACSSGKRPSKKAIEWRWNRFKVK